MWKFLLISADRLKRALKGGGVEIGQDDRPHVRPRMSRSGWIPVLLSMACTPTLRYIAPVSQQPLPQSAPIAVEISPLRYQTDPSLNPGWFEVKRIQLMLRNPSDEPVLVDWDLSAVIDSSGNTLRVVHSGVTYEDAKSGNYRTYQKRSLIAPHAMLKDEIIPVPWISLVGGRWMACIMPSIVSNISLSITVERGSERHTFAVPFTVEEGRLIQTAE
jgi:hypothetical protein